MMQTYKLQATLFVGTYNTGRGVFLIIRLRLSGLYMLQKARDLAQEFLRMGYCSGPCLESMKLLSKREKTWD